MKPQYDKSNWWRNAVRRCGSPTTIKVKKPGSHSVDNAIQIAVLEAECAKARANLKVKQMLKGETV
jgi:hypothetical protein